MKNVEDLGQATCFFWQPEITSSTRNAHNCVGHSSSTGHQITGQPKASTGQPNFRIVDHCGAFSVLGQQRGRSPRGKPWSGLAVVNAYFARGQRAASSDEHTPDTGKSSVSAKGRLRAHGNCRNLDLQITRQARHFYCSAFRHVANGPKTRLSYSSTSSARAVNASSISIDERAS